jgi:hypothetical protein
MLKLSSLVFTVLWDYFYLIRIKSFDYQKAHYTLHSPSITTYANDIKN